MPKNIIRDFPDSSIYGDRKAVCKRCHCVINDIEPCINTGEFWHPRYDKDGKVHWCKNAGKVFHTTDLELEPFLRKRDRRRQKRLGIKI